MQHFAVVSSLVGVGADASDVARSLKDTHDQPKNLSFWSREPISSLTVLETQVQALVALRIVQEYIAATETTGALLRSIRDRSLGGVMRLSNGYRVVDVRDFYDDIWKHRRQGIARLLNWPTPTAIARAGSADLAIRALRTFPKMRSWVVGLADLYLKGKPFRLVDLGRKRNARNDDEDGSLRTSNVND